MNNEHTKTTIQSQAPFCSSSRHSYEGMLVRRSRIHLLGIKTLGAILALSFLGITVIVVPQEALASSPLLTNISAYWKLDGNSTDSASTNNGTDTAITYGNAYGKINQGALYNGTTSNINLGNVLGTVFVGAHSVSGWMYPTGGSYAELVGKTTTNTSHPIDYYANLGTSLFFIAYIGDGTSAMVAQTPNNKITLNAWNFVVVTYDGSGNRSGISIYINGVSQTLTLSGSTTLTPVNGTDSTIIGSRSDAATTLTGNMDEVGIWSRVLTSSEVTQLYNSGAGIQYPFTTATLTSILTSWITWIF